MLKEKNKILRKLSSIKKEMEKFLRIFIFLFLIVIVILNWGTLKEMFNYKTIYGDMLSSLKTKFVSEKEIALSVPQIKLSEPEFEFSDKSDSLEIPKIEIYAPLVFPKSSQKNDLSKSLEQGVIFYPESVLPGEEGITVILGHSAPSNWPKINYDWVFTRINELNPGDEIFVYFNHRKYPYQITKKFFLKRGEEIPTVDLEDSKSVLLMLSCWPPGVDYKRIAVQAELEI